MGNRLHICALAAATIIVFACRNRTHSDDAGPGPAATATRPDNSLCAAGCKEDGRCASAVVNDTQIVGGRLDNTKSFKCVASSDAECRASNACKVRGECSKVGDECKPANDADCQASTNCKSSGNCTKTTVCAVTGAKDCSGEPCTLHGLCKFVSLGSDFGRCEPATSADCKRSASCSTDGQCGLVKDPTGRALCAPVTDADCSAAQICKSEQRCRRGTSVEGYACIR